MKKRILLLNGPNLNWLGKREPTIYGNVSLSSIEEKMTQLCKSKDCELICFQSNSEGGLIDFLQKEHTADYVIINAGAYTHTSVALRDCFASLTIPFIEVHISNVYQRENFRHTSYLSPLAQGCLIGLGVEGYILALYKVFSDLNIASL